MNKAYISLSFVSELYTCILFLREDGDVLLFTTLHQSSEVYRSLEKLP